MTRLILLDRDGVINRDSRDFVKSTAEFELLPGSLQAIAELQQAGFKLGVCTNQSGVGRGYLSLETLNEIHHCLAQDLAELGARLDTIRFCPHLPDAGCPCRKPRPGLLTEAMRELGVAPEQTVCVGDSLRDLEAASAAGCRAVLVRTGNGSATEASARAAGYTEIYDDLAAFAQAERQRIQAGAKDQQ